MANKKQKRERERRVRQQQNELRHYSEDAPRSERDVIKASRKGALYSDYGEDGRPMTPARNRLQRVLSIYTMWAFICVPVAACWFLLSCFDGQQAAFFGFLGFNGTVNGWDYAVVLRIEAVITLVGLLALLVNSFTFSWMFGQAPAIWYRAVTIIAAVIYIGYLAFCVMNYGMVEPIAVLNLAAIIIIWYAAHQVETEELPY